MREWQGKRYWLVGASDGLGAALAQVMSRSGAEVIISARSEDKLVQVVAGLPGKASYQVMDIADDEVIKAAQKLNRGKTPGCDNLPPEFWKAICEKLS